MTILDRARSLSTSINSVDGSVLYWMTREQRIQDNWGLWYAQQQANERQQALVVIFALRKDLTEASGTARMLEFMLAGLQEVESQLTKLNIPFVMWLGDPVDGVVEVAKIIKASQVVVDQFPLRIYRQWQTDLVSRLPITISQVDGHNVVPVWVASNKPEYTARTIRPKITKLLPEYLVEIPMIKKHDWSLALSCRAELIKICRHSVFDPESQNILQPRHPELVSGSQKSQDFSIARRDQMEFPLSNSSNMNWQIDWQKVRKLTKVDESIKSTDFVPGEKAAAGVLQDFIANRLEDYDSKRNDPNAAALSNLSPYLHFGQISAQRVALAVENSSTSRQAKTRFLEELIIRRELADNFCYYNSRYDSLAGAPSWAQKTLTEHLSDPRDYIYTLDQFAQAQTHDPLWNAAQTELIKTGKMHGYMRMYWAKKILEWSSSPQQAVEIAISLNDRYSLDGRDPNGYVGILWSIAGLHDRPWFKRPIFGSIRYMSASGCQKKFDVKSYFSTWLNLENYNYSTQSKSTSVSKSWLLFREKPKEKNVERALMDKGFI